jgi:hypothetical protein
MPCQDFEVVSTGLGILGEPAARCGMSKYLPAIHADALERFADHCPAPQ